MRWIVLVEYIILAVMLIIMAKRSKRLRPLAIWFLVVTFNGMVFQIFTILRALDVYSLPVVDIYNLWSILIRLHTVGTGIGMSLFYLRQRVT